MDQLLLPYDFMAGTYKNLFFIYLFIYFRQLWVLNVTKKNQKKKQKRKQKQKQKQKQN